MPESVKGWFPTAEEVDLAWLGAQLKANGIEDGLLGFEAEQVGTGQIGKCFRYRLTYQDDLGASHRPTSLIGKFPSDDPASRATGVMLKNFLKEVQFYQILQASLSIRTPKCYFSAIQGEGPDFVLLMEDLHPAEQGNQLLGCKPPIARSAIMQLVGLHAPSWCNQNLFEHPWLYDPQSAKDGTLRSLYNAQLPGFLERFGPHLAKDEQEIIAQVGESTTTPLYGGLPDIFSLVHVDYRLDNLLIGGSVDAPDVTAVDWQSITLGAPLNDVAYFMGAGLMAEDRRGVEQEIVREYHAGLLNAGVKDFSWDDCWTSYRRGTFAGFGVTVVASMLVQRTERGDQMFTAMAQRHARHALDLGADEFLA